MLNLTPLLHVPLTPEDLQQGARKLASLADAYREDPDLRSSFASDPNAALSENGVDVLPNVEVRVAEDTDEVFHFVLPPDFNADVADEVLESIAGGSCGKGGERSPYSRPPPGTNACGCGAGCIDSWTFGRD